MVKLVKLALSSTLQFGTFWSSWKSITLSHPPLESTISNKDWVYFFLIKSQIKICIVCYIIYEWICFLSANETYPVSITGCTLPTACETSHSVRSVMNQFQEKILTNTKLIGKFRASKNETTYSCPRYYASEKLATVLTLIIILLLIEVFPCLHTRE